MRRVTWPVYIMSISLVLVFAMIGYVIKENRDHQEQLARAVATREETINAYLGELCDRLQFRDEIQIDYLLAAVARYEKEDPEYAAVLARAAETLQISQTGCLEGIPSTEEGG